jgi:pimeloyl-ACP methyl ester carboxylesterase
MSTFVLIHGAGSGPDHWHLVAPLLRDGGHQVVTPDLPRDSDTAGLPEYTDAALAAVGDRDDLIVVGQSLGAFTAAAVAATRPTRLLVYVNAMIPARGESPGGWWHAVGHAEAAAQTLRRHGPMRTWTTADLAEVFLHDVPVAAAAGATPRPQGGGIFATPLLRWPAGVPVRVISGRDDRLFPLAFQQRLARERLGVEPNVLPGGHLLALAQPAALAEQLLAYLSTPARRELRSDHRGD